MRRLSAAALLAGLLIAAVSAGRTWLMISTIDPVLGEIGIDTSGNDLSPAITGALVLAGAATLVAVLTRGWLRRICTAVLFIDGIWACWLAVSVLVEPSAAAASASRPDGGALGSLGSGAAEVSAVEVTFWPWVFTLAAALIMLGAAGALWAGLRPEPPRTTPKSDAAARTSSAPDLSATELRRRQNARAWDDLSEGKDLTP